MYICKLMLSEFFVNLRVNARASNFTQEGDSPLLTPSNHKQLIMGALQPIQVKKKDKNRCKRNRISVKLE